MKDSVLEDFYCNFFEKKTSISIGEQHECNAIVSKSSGSFRSRLCLAMPNGILLGGSTLQDTLLFNFDDLLCEWKCVNENVRIQANSHRVQDDHCCEDWGLH